MNTFNDLKEKWQNISDLAERQRATAQALDTAQNDGDEALMAAICHHVIGNENATHQYAADFQVSCLHWLTEDCIERLNAQKTEEEKEAVWQELFGCLWSYKWYVPDLPDVVDISREQIDFYNELMRDYYQRGGFALAPFHKVMMLQAISMGNVEEAKRQYQAWHESAKDEIGDCEVCELNDEVIYYHFIGQYKKALQLAEPILSGEKSCGEVPHLTYYPAIESLIQTADWHAAEHHLEQAVALIGKQSDEFVHLLPRLIQLHIRLGKYSQAEALIEQFHEKIAHRSQINPMMSLQYLMAVAYFDEAAKEQAQELAELFDARNGNRYYSKYLQQLLVRQQPTLQ